MHKSIYRVIPVLITILLIPGTTGAQSLSGWDGYMLADSLPRVMVDFDATADGDLDAAGTVNLPLNGRWSFNGSVMVTDRARQYLGATHTRPDLPVPYSTGRVLSGEVRYQGAAFQLRLGRLFPDYHPWRQVSPLARETISGDGVDARYESRWLNFHSRVQFLRNEVSGGETINRVFNYHRLGLVRNQWELGLGEFLIYTGHDRGIDWVWSNPLVPYIVHNFDYYSTSATQWNGDRDNTVLYADLAWSGIGGSVTTRLYVDEFQVDGKDREVQTDEYLWHSQGLMPLTEGAWWRPSELGMTLALASAGFGYHYGLFTDFFVGNYGLMPHETGRVQHVALTGVWLKDRGHVILDLFHSGVADISGLNPIQLHQREYVEALAVESVQGLRLRGEYELKSWLRLRGDWRWTGAEREVLLGVGFWVSG